MAKSDIRLKRGPRENHKKSLEIVVSYLIEAARENPALWDSVHVVKDGITLGTVREEPALRGVKAAIAKRLKVPGSTVARAVERWLADPILLRKAQLVVIDRTWNDPPPKGQVREPKKSR